MKKSNKFKILPITIVSMLAACGSLETETETCFGETCQATSCDDPGYGDGICQTDLACTAPDIDCFLIFADQSEANTWWVNAFEIGLAQEENRAQRSIVPANDARFVRAQNLLDESWSHYQEVFPVGDLAGSSPQLIVLEDKNLSAFAAPDLASGRSAFAVIVLTGLIDASSDEALFAAMTHELRHSAGLHLIADVKERVRKFYIAPQGQEPLGFEQPISLAAHKHGVAWRKLAEEVGPFHNQELSGLPFGSSLLGQVLSSALEQHAKSNKLQCSGPVAEYNQLMRDLEAKYSRLDGTLDLSDKSIMARISNVRSSLRDDCLVNFPQNLVQVIAQYHGVSETQIRTQMTAQQSALLEGKDFVDGIFAVVGNNREKLRQIEAMFAVETGADWSSLRYFSFEEDADDATVSVMRKSRYRAQSLSTSLLASEDASFASACQDLITQGTPPYGVDLGDEHHATCWRIHHVKQMAESNVIPAISAVPQDDVSAPQNHEPAGPRSILLPPIRLSDALAN